MRNRLPESSCTPDISSCCTTLSISQISGECSITTNHITRICIIMYIVMMIYNHTYLHIFQLIAVHFMSCSVKIQHITNQNSRYEKYI